LENIYVVLYKPYYPEVWSAMKAFKNERDAEKFIEEEKAKERKLVGELGFIGDYDIKEIELIQE
jgi:hypothetical protein